MRPPIIAFQQHSSGIWDRVALALVSAMQHLKAVESVTGVERPDLHAALLAIREEASAQRAKGQRLLAELQIEEPDRYRRCWSGLEPWPDEDALTFTGRCNCHDQCFHRFADDPAANYVGTGDPKEAARNLVESPWFQCNCPGVRPPCPVPGHPLEEVPAQGESGLALVEALVVLLLAVILLWAFGVIR